MLKPHLVGDVEPDPREYEPADEESCGKDGSDVAPILLRFNYFTCLFYAKFNFKVNAFTLSGYLKISQI